MGNAFEFDEVNNILRCAREGRITDDHIWEAFHTAEKLGALRPPFRVIDDCSGATRADISTGAIERLAKMPSILGGAETMLVIIAPIALIYGLARMFSMLGEIHRPNVHVVQTTEEAYALLGVTHPQFSPVTVP